MIGDYRVSGDFSTLVSFLIHHLNQRMNRSRLDITESFCDSLFI